MVTSMPCDDAENFVTAHTYLLSKTLFLDRDISHEMF